MKNEDLTNMMFVIAFGLSCFASALIFGPNDGSNFEICGFIMTLISTELVYWFVIFNDADNTYKFNEVMAFKVASLLISLVTTATIAIFLVLGIWALYIFGSIAGIFLYVYINYLLTKKLKGRK